MASRLSMSQQRRGFRLRPAASGVARVAFSGEFVGSRVFRAVGDNVKTGRIVSIGLNAFRVAWDKDGSVTVEQKSDYDVILDKNARRHAAALSPEAERLINGAWAEEEKHYYQEADANTELMYGPRSFYWSVIEQETGEEIATGTAESEEEARYRCADAYDRLVLAKEEVPVEEPQAPVEEPVAE